MFGINTYFFKKKVCAAASILCIYTHCDFISLVPSVSPEGTDQSLWCPSIGAALGRSRELPVSPGITGTGQLLLRQWHRSSAPRKGCKGWHCSAWRREAPE